MEPRRVHEVVHSLRQKPLHVRERMAVGAATGITLVVALGWFATNMASGTFSLVPNSIIGANSSIGEATAKVQKVGNGNDGNGFDSLLGAAGNAFGGSSTPSSITVVDTQVHSTLDSDTPDPNATVLHF